MTQWLRLCLPIQGLWVRSLVRDLWFHIASVPNKKKEREREQKSSSVLFLTMHLSSGIRKLFGLILPEWKRQWEFMLLYLSLKWRNGSKRLVFGQWSALVKLAWVGTIWWSNSWLFFPLGHLLYLTEAHRCFPWVRRYCVCFASFHLLDFQGEVRDCCYHAPCV